MRSALRRFNAKYASLAADHALSLSALATSVRCASTSGAGGEGNDAGNHTRDDLASSTPPDVSAHDEPLSASARPRTAWVSPQDTSHRDELSEARHASAHTRLHSLFSRHDARMRQSSQPGVETAAASPLAYAQQQSHIRTSIRSTDVDHRGVVGKDRFAVDEDGEGLSDLALQPVPARSHARGHQRSLAPQTALATPATVTLENLEEELLDDAFHYFAPVPLSGSTVIRTSSSTSVQPSNVTLDEAAAGAQEMTMPDVRYVPGQQIIPPGFTRYRVDVQYQGADFDGWYKSSTRRLVRRHVLADGSVRTVPLNAEQEAAARRDAGEEEEGARQQGVRRDGGASTRYHAKTVLEDALAVALDVPSVAVVASVIPEVGVSVRRLPCHVDIPSDVEMQPRTILQRATLWLQQRQQPLAILSCQRCHNQDFHARHGRGVRRVYCYRILNRVAPPLFDAGFQWHVDRHLDVARMQRFAAALEGTHDYGYFADPKMANALRRAAASTVPGGFASAAVMDEHEEPLSLGLRPGEVPAAPKVTFEKGLGQLERAAALPTFNAYGQTVLNFDAKPRQYFKAATNLPTVRTIDTIRVVRQDDEVLIWFVGQSFLRHQIRLMVSVLKASGHGLWDELELQSALQSGFEVSRKKFKRERFPAAPVCGLTLWDVEYPRVFQDDYVPFVDSGPYEEVDISNIH